MSNRDGFSPSASPSRQKRKEDAAAKKRTRRAEKRSERPTAYGSNDANGWREGPAEYDYMHRYDSPDNERDSMG